MENFSLYLGKHSINSVTALSLSLHPMWDVPNREAVLTGLETVSVLATISKKEGHRVLTSHADLPSRLHKVGVTSKIITASLLLFWCTFTEATFP